jgi:hypothetical protein
MHFEVPGGRRDNEPSPLSHGLMRQVSQGCVIEGFCVYKRLQHLRRTVGHDELTSL